MLTVAAMAVVVGFGRAASGGAVSAAAEPAGGSPIREEVPGPGPRTGAAAAFDSSTGELVLFGGWRAGEGEGTNLSDGWRWDGRRWRPVTSPGPSARSWATLTYDAEEKSLILFGGKVDNTKAGTYGDTWRLRGDEWTRIEAEVAPSPRAHHSAAWDSTRRGVVLFGGSDHEELFDDLWIWRQGRWRPQELEAGPAARTTHAMYDDPQLGGVVLHGGSAHPWPPMNLSDRWLVSEAGSRPLGAAPARALHLAARSAGGLLISGGWGFEATAVTAAWLETPEGWRRLDDASAPPPRSGAAYAVDPRSRTVFVYGGSDADFQPLADFWRFDGEEWWEVGAESRQP